MPRKLDPLKQVQKDTRALLKLWRATVKHYTDLLSNSEGALPATTMTAINQFLTSNRCTLDEFLNLSALEKLRQIDSKAEQEVLRIEGPKTVDQDLIDEQQLEKDLEGIPYDDDFESPLKDENSDFSHI